MTSIRLRLRFFQVTFNLLKFSIHTILNYAALYQITIILFMKVCGNNQGLTVWFTGLSGSGKTTLSEMLKASLEEFYHRRTVILDGDKIRRGINQGLGFSQEDRAENIRRVSEMAKLLNQEGLICIVACISPYGQDRLRARQIHQKQNLKFYQIFVDCELQECEKRDPKGLYKKAREGLLPKFTGVSDPYEAPENADLVIPTSQQTLSQSFQKLQSFICENYLSQGNSRSEKFIYKDLVCDPETLNLLQVFQQGWTEVTCFMNYEQILQSIYFKSYTKENKETIFQPLPLFLLVSAQFSQDIRNNSNIKIRFINPINQSIIAVLDHPKVQVFRHEEFANKIFGTQSSLHPKISQWLKKGDFILSGSKLTFKCLKIYYNDGLDYYRKDVQTLKKELKRLDCDCVFAFQLRNPLHNGHLFLLEKAKQDLLKKGYKNPILLLHPCGGWVKDDDVPLEVRVRQHEVLLKQNKHFNKGSYLLSIWPSPMYYGGPLEVLWHIKSREMLNIQFMVVGRDPAGLKHPDNPKIDLYDPFDGHRVIEIAQKLNLIKMKIIPFKVISWNKVKKELMEFDESKKQEFEMISGSQMRLMAKSNEEVPEWFMNQESWIVLKQFYQQI